MEENKETNYVVCKRCCGFCPFMVYHTDLDLYYCDVDGKSVRLGMSCRHEENNE